MLKASCMPPFQGGARLLTYFLWTKHTADTLSLVPAILAVLAHDVHLEGGNLHFWTLRMG
jgi:hypothetical protein